MRRNRLITYPIGNADCNLIQTADGRLIAVDYAAVAGGEPDDLRIDLPGALRQDIGPGREIDVLVLTHLDMDHFKGASEFFHLDHSPRHQGASRIRVRELWVPAAVIVEEGLEGEARVIQQEARFRLRNGSGIRVFSHARALDRWMRREGLDPKSRASLITSAGTCVPGFSLARDGLEVFVHAPFAEAAESSREIERNSTSIVLHLTFDDGDRPTRVFLGADIECEDLAKIVFNSERSGNHDRLLHDIAKLPHHLSYGSLSRDKGARETRPLDLVRKFYEQYGLLGEHLIGSSKVVEPGATEGPPHPEAARYYRRVAEGKRGMFVVTMEYPSKSAPDRLILEIGPSGVSIVESPTHGTTRRVTAPVVLVPGSPGPPPHPRVQPPERPSKPWAEIRPTGGNLGSPGDRPPREASPDRSAFLKSNRLDLLQLLAGQIARVQERHPNLSLIWQERVGLAVTGFLGFSMNFGEVNVVDQYRLEIWIPDNYPDTIPIVFELDGKIPRSYGHFMLFGNLCLGAPIDVLRRFAENPTLIRFIEDLVVPYLASWSHFRDHGRSPFGELAHGARGLLDFYGDEFDTNRISTLGLLAHLADGSPKEVRRCPCGSGRPIEHCHATVLRQLQPHMHQTFDDELKGMIAWARETHLKLPRWAVPAKFREERRMAKAKRNLN